MAALTTRMADGVRADPARVIARLFLPGEELDGAPSRAAQIVGRVMQLDEADITAMAEQLETDFATRHHNFADLLARHCELVAAHIGSDLTVSGARELVLGASFTAEYAVEAAAVCNPSAMIHPDQSGLSPGQVRVAISLRGIGEGHISSIGFCTAIAGPGVTWSFEPRNLPIATGQPLPGVWARDHFAAVLADQGPADQLAMAVLRLLPREMTGIDLELALASVRSPLLSRAGSTATMERLRRLVASAYGVRFDESLSLDQRVLMPLAAEESVGMEDARFTLFTNDDNIREYRATYTAYDGHNIAPRMLTSPDLRTFQAHRLAGTAARNKGMALFPRVIAGQHLALCRSDGESTGLTRSQDGLSWDEPTLLQRPIAGWEVIQVGNCGPPLETEQGWLVLTHGVGPMRQYSIGALLLDLEDPTRVLGHLPEPLLTVATGEQNGYVPNVVYSCGAILLDDVVWLPYGVDDTRVAVAHASLAAILDAMRPNR